MELLKEHHKEFHHSGVVNNVPKVASGELGPRFGSTK